MGPRVPTLISVNRGPQNAEPFRHPEGIRPGPRTFDFQGKTIHPLEPGIHPIQRGPLGESFTNAVVRTHPEMGNPAGRPMSGLMTGPRGNFNPPGTGTRTFGAPPTFNAPRYGGNPSAGGGGFSGAGAGRGSFSAGSAGSGRGYSGGGASGGGSSGGGFSGGGHVSAPSAAPAGGGGGGGGRPH